MSGFRKSEFRVLASGLGYPEGPVYQSDGSVLVVEIANGTLTQVSPDGSKKTVADLHTDPSAGTGPNGAAIGPDGAIYVCNNGGVVWNDIPASPKNLATKVPLFQAPNYKTGSIQRVSNSSVTTLYTDCKVQNATVPLRSPDDLVFDSKGNFWFSDWGKLRPTDRDITAIYYAQAGGQSIMQMLPMRSAPNGIALSPEDDRLYVAETYARWIVYWKLDKQGAIVSNKDTLDGSYLLTSDLPGPVDSMAVDEKGNVYVATMMPKGQNASIPGGITVVSPEGKILDFIELMVDGMPEPLPSNICFGGPDRRTAFITLAGTGRLVSCKMKIPGKALHCCTY